MSPFSRVALRRLFCCALVICGVASSLATYAKPAAAQSVESDISAGVGVAATQEAREAAQRHQLAMRALNGPSAQSSSPTSPTAGTPSDKLNVFTDNDAQKPGFYSDRIVYSADIGVNLAGGATNSTNNIPGTFDASLIYSLGRTTRVGAYYYQFSAYPIGNDDTAPVYFQGTNTPIGTANLHSKGADATTHLRFQVYTIQQMFTIGGHHHPLILVPFYGSVRSSLGGQDDSTTIFANNTVQTVHLRSYENHGANLVIPLFYDINYLISYTGTVVWNVNNNGANITNHAQYEQALYAQFQPTDRVTLFANAANNVQYFPSEVYPYHSPTFHYGITKVIKKPFFIEAEVSTTGPQNPNYYGTGRIGIPKLVVPCASTAAGGNPTLTCVALAANGVAVPVLGAQRATTFSLLFGIGAHPVVQPF